MFEEIDNSICNENFNIRDFYSRDKNQFREYLCIPDYFHELDMDQKNKYHSFTVIEHTFRVIENITILQEIFRNLLLGSNFTKTDIETNKKIFFYAALFHDLGKLDPRCINEKPDGSLSFYGNKLRIDKLRHEESSCLLWKTFVDDKPAIESSELIGNIIYGHMLPHSHTKLSDPENTLKAFTQKHYYWKYLYIHAMADALSKDEHCNIKNLFQYVRNLNIIDNQRDKT